MPKRSYGCNILQAAYYRDSQQKVIIMSVKLNLLKLTITALALSTCVAPSLAESNRSQRFLRSDLQVAGLDDMFNTIRKKVEDSVEQKISNTVDNVMSPSTPPAKDKNAESAPHPESATTSSGGSAYFEYIKGNREVFDYCFGNHNIYKHLSVEKRQQFAAMRAYLIHENKLQQFPPMPILKEKTSRTTYKNLREPNMSSAEEKEYYARDIRACEALIAPLAAGYDKPPVNNNFRGEADELRKFCESNLSYKDAYDCACLGAKALEYKTQNPYQEIKGEALASHVGNQCPNYEAMRPKFLYQCETSTYVNNLKNVPKGPLCECTADGAVVRMKEKVGQSIEKSIKTKLYNEAMAQCIQKLR